MLDALFVDQRRSAHCNTVALCTPVVAGLKELARLDPIVPVQCTNSRFRSSLVAKVAPLPIGGAIQRQLAALGWYG
jgi:hypothetical protein